MELKSLKNYQIISIAAFFMSSLQPILMSSAGFDEEGTRRVLAYGSAILFWLFLAIGIVTQIIMYIKLKGEIKGAPGHFQLFQKQYFRRVRRALRCVACGEYCAYEKAKPTL